VIVKTEAIVVKRMKFRETSAIVTLLTRDFGRLSVIAKGARDSKSRLGPLLNSLNHLQVVLYKKDGRDLHLITQCDLLQRFPSLTDSLERLGCSMAVVELAYAVSESEEDSTALFVAALNALRVTEQGGNPAVVLLAFETRLLDILGFQPDLCHCVQCRRPVAPVSTGTKSNSFRLTASGIVCQSCLIDGNTEQEIASAPLEILQRLQLSGANAGGEGVEARPEVLRDSRRVLRYFLRTHVDGIRALKSETVFSAL